jgi:3-hydroxy-3-methylglutaryl CoA synthase
MKKQFKLVYSYGEGSTDEYFCQEHNITLAKKKLLTMLKSDQKPVSLGEYVKGKGWKINNMVETEKQ